MRGVLGLGVHRRDPGSRRAQGARPGGAGAVCLRRARVVRDGLSLRCAAR